MMRRSLLLPLSCVAALLGCSGRDGDTLTGAAVAEAAMDETSVAEASSSSDAEVDASVLDASVEATAADVAVVDAPASPDASSPAPDGSAAAPRGCYLEGYAYCPAGTWCPLGICPDGITPYGCLCNEDGTTTCSLDCPN
jgi:hypothetical protein